MNRPICVASTATAVWAKSIHSLNEFPSAGTSLSITLRKLFFLRLNDVINANLFPFVFLFLPERLQLRSLSKLYIFAVELP
jgi:hypothetical protein